MTTPLIDMYKGYGFHLPDKILFNGQNEQIGKWTPEMEIALKEHMCHIPVYRQHQITLTAKAYLHMSGKVPKDFYNMVDFVLNNTNAKVHIQVIEYDPSTFPGPTQEIEDKKRFATFINTFVSYTRLHRERLMFSFGNEPTLNKEVNSWKGTLDEFRAWQAGRIKEAKGFQFYIGNEADIMGTLANLKWHLANNTKFSGVVFHIYKPKGNHPYHLATLRKAINHMCHISDKKVPVVLVGEHAYTVLANGANEEQYNLWAYHAPRHSSDNGIRSNFFSVLTITPTAHKMMLQGLEQLRKDEKAFYPEMPYGEDERIRNGQISSYLALKNINDELKNFKDSAEGVAGYNEVLN